MRIAVVACGYADGYPRHAPTGTPVYVEGKNINGRKSFDGHALYRYYRHTSCIYLKRC